MQVYTYQPSNGNPETGETVLPDVFTPYTERLYTTDKPTMLIAQTDIETENVRVMLQDGRYHEPDEARIFCTTFAPRGIAINASSSLQPLVYNKNTDIKKLPILVNAIYKFPDQDLQTYAGYLNLTGRYPNNWRGKVFPQFNSTLLINPKKLFILPGSIPGEELLHAISLAQGNNGAFYKHQLSEAERFIQSFQR